LNIIDMSTSDFLAKALENNFIAAHEMSTDPGTPLDIKGLNAFVANHLQDLEELVSDFVAERY
tara:strand:+ start:1529 stop:1717 length:189 start_codon:yes stop_codon:yes gene_type:complete